MSSGREGWGEVMPLESWGRVYDCRSEASLDWVRPSWCEGPNVRSLASLVASASWCWSSEREAELAWRGPRPAPVQSPSIWLLQLQPARRNAALDSLHVLGNTQTDSKYALSGS